MAWCGEESLFYWGKTMLLFSAESPDPFPGPYSCLSLWLYVRCCPSCWLMKLWGGVGPGWQEASALIYILQLGQWLALWPAELWCNRFPGCIWIAAASQSQPGMCGCEHMAQCSADVCSPCIQACLCLPGQWWLLEFFAEEIYDPCDYVLKIKL